MTRLDILQLGIWHLIRCNDLKTSIRIALWPTCKVVNAGAAVLVFSTKVPSHGLKENRESRIICGATSNANPSSTQYKIYGNLLWFTFKTYVGLSTSRLAIGETCGHASFKSSIHKGFGCEPARDRPVDKKYSQKGQNLHIYFSQYR